MVVEKIRLTQMFNSNTSADTRIAVLEERISSYEVLLKKIDEAIQIMGKTSQNISKMLAVHEEKIENCEKSDNLITKMIDDLKKENKEQHEGVEKRIAEQHKEVRVKIADIENEVKDIGKIKWMTVGCGVLLAVLTTAVSTLASGWWSPSEMQMQRNGHTYSPSGTKTP